MKSDMHLKLKEIIILKLHLMKFLSKGVYTCLVLKICERAASSQKRKILNVSNLCRGFLLPKCFICPFMVFQSSSPISKALCPRTELERLVSFIVFQADKDLEQFPRLAQKQNAEKRGSFVADRHHFPLIERLVAFETQRQPKGVCIGGRIAFAFFHST